MDRIIDFIFYTVLIFISIKDLKEKIIPDIFNLVIIFLGIVKIIFLHGDFEKSFIGMGVFPIIFIFLYGYVSDFLKKDVIGFGDIKLMGAAGFFLEYSGIYNLIILYNTIFITALVCILPLLCFGKIKEKQKFLLLLLSRRE